MELTTEADGRVGALSGGRGRRWGQAGGPESRGVQVASRAVTESAAAGAVSRGELEDLWDRHGGSAYALACALLGDEMAASEAVRLAMADLARSRCSLSTEEAGRFLVRQVYRCAQEFPGEPSGAAQLPPVMVWVSQLARLQRASLALCVFGGLTHHEAAALLDVPPSGIAGLLTAGLRELGLRAAGASAACA